ncbi:MAG: biopolymer transporter ExbD [Pseudomonadales bacterium]|nr:biopolymer transporter ExbD [Pseudomonadales bacterium]
MKQSRRAKRLQRHHNSKIVAKLNMISLMDIFTILVFFLLVNSTNNQQFANQDTITLPESTAEKAPRATLSLFVDANNIYVQDRLVTDIPSVLRSKELIIPALKKELDYRHQHLSSSDLATPEARSITIIGDKKIPYRLLKKIMSTCSKSQYSEISLAVYRKSVRAEL